MVGKGGWGVVEKLTKRGSSVGRKEKGLMEELRKRERERGGGGK